MSNELIMCLVLVFVKRKESEASLHLSWQLAKKLDGGGRHIFLAHLEALWKLCCWNHHHSGFGPSVSYFRSHSIVPPLIPSHGKPTIDQVATNLQSSLGSILDVIQEHNKGKTSHGVVILDEIATEKQIHWDPTSNMFLGLCQEHGNRTSLEFINEGGLEELFC